MTGARDTYSPIRIPIAQPIRIKVEGKKNWQRLDLDKRLAGDSKVGRSLTIDYDVKICDILYKQGAFVYGLDVKGH